MTKRRRGSQRTGRPDGYRRATTTPVGGPIVANRLPGLPVLTLGAVVVVLVIAGALLVLRPGVGGGTGGAVASASASASASATPAAAGTCPTSQPPALGTGQTRTVTIQTGKGPIVIQVKADLSPIATAEFVALADCGFYSGSPFHRVVPKFVIQGGESATGAQLGYTIKDEPVTATYSRGVVAMARTSQPNSVDSQFFIVMSDDARQALASYNTYQIVGTVTSGMETADAIVAAGSGDNVANPVTMTSVTVANP